MPEQLTCRATSAAACKEVRFLAGRPGEVRTTFLICPACQRRLTEEIPTGGLRLIGPAQPVYLHQVRAADAAAELDFNHLPAAEPDRVGVPGLKVPDEVFVS
jgi:hypothetical protein